MYDVTNYGKRKGELVMSLIQDIVSCRELYWENADVVRGAKAPAAGETEKIVDIDDAEARLARFAPFIKRVFC